jgi:hypothetical protein
MSERDQAASALVKFGQGRARTGGLNVAANARKDQLHSRLAVDFARNVSIDGHDVIPSVNLPKSERILAL